MKKCNVSAIALTFVLIAVICGCGTGGVDGVQSASTPTTTIKTLSGKVHGGQQPVSSAVIQLYAVGITGLRSAATPLLSASVSSDQNGNFSISGDWNCTSNTAVYGTNPLLYIVASGGNPGLASGTNNAAITMMAALGPCNTLTSSSYIWIDELTTVAAAYALAPFMGDAAHVGATGAYALGITNAFTNASLLANWSTGAAPGNLPATATAPVAELNSLGNLLAACVNTSGVDGACAALFAAAKPGTGAAPTNTLGIILNIAANPASHTATLFNLIPPQPPFQPALTASPNDWTVALNFTGGGLNAPTALALDASGDVWVANAGGNSVSELSPGGTLLTGSSGYTGNGNLLGAQGIAIDRTGNVWLADTLLSSIVKLSVNNGAVQSATSFTSGGVVGPTSIAIDSQNNVWVANFAGGSVTELNNSGTPVGAGPLTAGGALQAPLDIAIDHAGGVWITDNLASDVVEYSASQSLLSGAGFTDGAIAAPAGIALDSGGRAWVSYQGTNAVSYYTSGTNQSATLPYTGGGLSTPSAVAIDGQGTIWIANNQMAGNLSQLSLSQTIPLSPATGFGSLNAPAAIAIDSSGDIWTANSGDSSISEFLGMATPSSMPLTLKAGP